MAQNYAEITKKLLSYLAITGVAVITGPSPYPAMLRFLKSLAQDQDYLKELEGRRKLSSALYRLRKSRLIIMSEREEGTFVVRLTEKGKQKTKEIKFADLKLVEPQQWDGIWRVVIFDIPERKKIAREALRKKLMDLGFYQLQKSVWVCPFPCKEEIEFLVELFQIYPYVHMLEARSIQNDIKVRKHFHLL